MYDRQTESLWSQVRRKSGGAVKAYPLKMRRQKKAFTDTLAGRKLAFNFDPAADQ
jgi:hypothetical protein